MLLSWLYLFSLTWNLHFGRFPSWRSNELDIFVIWFTFIELVSAGFETRYLSLLTKLSKSCLKVHQYISVGIGINDGPFLNKGCYACGNSLLLKLIAFWSGHVVLATSIISLSFSQYNNFFWLLWYLRFDFLNFLFFRGWSKIVTLSLWYFDCCLFKIVEDSNSFSFLIALKISVSSLDKIFSFRIL